MHVLSRLHVDLSRRSKDILTFCLEGATRGKGSSSGSVNDTLLNKPFSVMESVTLPSLSVRVMAFWYSDMHRSLLHKCRAVASFKHDRTVMDRCLSAEAPQVSRKPPFPSHHHHSTTGDQLFISVA